MKLIKRGKSLIVAAAVIGALFMGFAHSDMKTSSGCEQSGCPTPELPPLPAFGRIYPMCRQDPVSSAGRFSALEMAIRWSQTSTNGTFSPERLVSKKRKALQPKRYTKRLLWGRFFMRREGDAIQRRKARENVPGYYVNISHFLPQFYLEFAE